MQTFIKYFLARPRIKITALLDREVVLFVFRCLRYITYVYGGGSEHSFLQNLGDKGEPRFVCNETVPDPPSYTCVTAYSSHGILTRQSYKLFIDSF